MSFLRFRPDEFRAIARVCQPITFTNDFFPLFQQFLIRSLRDAWPELARRVARLRPPQVRLLYRHLRGRDDARYGLTLEELRLVSRAWDLSVTTFRFVAVLKTFLVTLFRPDAPGLARKLARLSDEQFARLYELLQERKRRST